MNLKTSQHTYFLGIGGIGMSALAHWRLGQGLAVSGYDRTESVVTRGLMERGATIFFQEDPAHLEGVDYVVYTPAIPGTHAEYQAARAQGLPMVKRAFALGELSQTYKTLAIAGTHGKTSTSALLAHILRYSGVDATAFLGGLVRSLEGNFVAGSSEWMVAEADEYDRSFLHLHPTWTIITALDPDHLDIYGSAEAMFASYVELGKQSEHLLVHTSAADAGWDKPVLTYGLNTGDYQARNLRTEGLTSVFDWVGPDVAIQGLRLRMPGTHNVLNATAALALARIAGADVSRFGEALAQFTGIYRRFEILADSPDLSYVDDYAHHPTEIAAAIQTARDLYPDRQLVVVFQPHLYSRTRDFAEGFATELARADVVRLMDIYPARELPLPGITSEMIVQKMDHPDTGLVTRKDLLGTLGSKLKEPAILLSLGAGDIDKEVPAIRNWVRSRISPLPTQTPKT